MQLATTTGDFGRYTKDYFACVKYVCEAGFRHLDLSLYTIREGDPLFYGEDWQDYARRLKAYARELGVDFVQCHSLSTNNLGDGPDDYENAVSMTKRAIEVCGILGIPNLVVHAGFSPKVTDRDIWFEENRRFFAELFTYMEEHQVNVLCENSTRANMGTRYYLFSGRDMSDFVKYVDHPLFHGCWDTGHANAEGSQYQDILDLGEDLYAIHFNDNRGTADEHLPPFMGTMNMDEVMTGLREINFKGPLTFEAAALKSSRYWLWNRRKFEKDIRLAEPPLILHKEMERFMYLTGEYILKAYDCFEE